MRLSLRSALALSLGLGAGCTAAPPGETAPAFDPAAEDDVFSIETVVYRQDDGGGNPFVDEDASIFESLILVNRRLDEDDWGHFRGIVDVISAASYDEFKDIAMTSGATGINPGRLGVAGGGVHRFDRWTLGLGGSFDQEFAYRSLGASADLSRPFNENNTALSLHLQSYFDTVRMIRFDGTLEDDESRNTLAGEVAVDQVLSPSSRLRLALHHTYQEGYLGTSFHSVFAGNVEEDEVVPGSRQRSSASARYKHAVGERDAVELGYRYYDDDWGIAAHTAEVRYLHYLEQDLVLEPVYRRYDQSGADFFAVTFPSTQPLQTSDPDLGPFSGDMLGLLVRFVSRRILGVEADWIVGFHHYDRSDGLTLSWLTFGFSHAY